MEPAFHGEGRGAVDGLEDEFRGDVAGEAQVHRCGGREGREGGRVSG